MLPEHTSVADAAAVLRDAARRRVVDGRDVRLHVLRVLLGSVISHGGARDSAALDSPVCALVRAAEASVGCGDDERPLLDAIVAVLSAHRAGGERLLDCGGGALFANAVQAFLWAEVLQPLSVIAWHAASDATPVPDEAAPSALDPRATTPWTKLVRWLREHALAGGAAASEDDAHSAEGAPSAARCAGGVGASIARPPASSDEWERIACSARTSWTPERVRVALSVELGAAREQVIALDGVVDEWMRAAILEFVTEPGWDHSGGPPRAKWERATADGEGLPRTWGLKRHVPDGLKALPAVRELHARLRRLYPAYAIAHMPAVGSAANGAVATCTQFVGNATVPGDSYQWHVDADPLLLRPEAHGRDLAGYANGAPGRPLLVSMLLYLNPEWRASWDAETLFRDPERSAGVLVQPIPGRVVLMAQDVVHRASAPSARAPCPRYSLVWKLAFLGGPQRHGGASADAVTPGTAASQQAVRVSLAREEWGPPSLV